MGYDGGVSVGGGGGGAYAAPSPLRYGGSFGGGYTDDQMMAMAMSGGRKDLAGSGAIETLDVTSTGQVLDGDKYAAVLPPLPEPRMNRRVDQNRLREMRKKLEGHATMKDVEALFAEVIDEAVDLCTDYIGNVVIQKIIEKSTDQHRLRLIEKVAPHMAAIGVHKNGTWVIQKMIDYAKTTTQIHHIINALKPFTPPLLLDQFGNYVVQCCLRLGTHRNQFVFDAMHTKCWDIGQGRFGSRAMRACLESQYTTKRQQKHVAIAIVQNGVGLCTNPNGAILITWLLDTSSLPGRYRVLAPKLVGSVSGLCTHKLASATILKLVNQRVELDARDIIIKEIFFSSDAALEEVLADQVHGVSVVQKILASACVSAEEKIRLADRVRSVLGRMPEVKDNHMGYKRLLDELSVIPVGGGGFGDGMGGVGVGGWGQSQEIVSPLTPNVGFFVGALPSGPPVTGQQGGYFVAGGGGGGGGTPGTPGQQQQQGTHSHLPTPSHSPQPGGVVNGNGIAPPMYSPPVVPNVNGQYAYSGVVPVSPYGAPMQGYYPAYPSPQQHSQQQQQQQQQQQRGEYISLQQMQQQGGLEPEERIDMRELMAEKEREGSVGSGGGAGGVVGQQQNGTGTPLRTPSPGQGQGTYA
ncbi:hypothetical protein HDV00_008095 [Rhizophlyctis rosea]|nr:hypothetical protein HDV00_008095 [Rhizophlyctis rosea]